MNKLDVLVDVVERVKQEGVIRFEYYKDGCYCAVGHLMGACGIDVTQFGRSTVFSGLSINSIILHDSLKPMRDLGFKSSELEALQRANDKSYFDSEDANAERKANVLSLLETFIRQTEIEEGEIVNG